MSDVDNSTIEPPPVYLHDQVPQSAFSALVTRIAVSTWWIPNARLVLEDFIESQKAPAYNGTQTPEPPKPIDIYPSTNTDPLKIDPLTYVKQRIIEELFNAIRREDSESIALLIQHNLVTANTTYRYGQTPLLEAISSKIVHIVKELLELGADPNAFGLVYQYGLRDRASRTPLMHAASIGSLPIVKLLFEPPYSANDALVAPDGQIALRLASAAGHRAIVEYLPSRRAGGFLRWKTQNVPSMARIKKAFQKTGTFISLFVWDLPKFFAWELPKRYIVLPVARSCKWIWQHRKELGAWCKHQLTKLPKRVTRFGKWIWRKVKKIPKEVWKFGTETLPRWINKVSNWILKLVTVHIPKAVVVAPKWIWAAINWLGKAVGDVILKTASLLHTVLLATITFLRNATLKDIWNGICDVLRAVFIFFPANLSLWMRKLERAAYQLLLTHFGDWGEVIWILVFVLLYVPSKLWIILRSLGGSIVRGWYEMVAWVNPKA